VSRCGCGCEFGPPELAALPWEFLYDSTRDDYLCLGAPLVRYLDVLEPRRPLTVNPPLRILAMVARPDELDALDVNHERRRLTEALADLEASGRVRLGWVRGQTWWDLQRELDQDDWHIFHFIGHGSLDSVTGEGVIAFSAEDGGVHRVGASDLALLLAEEQSLRLVVLNSCNTARASATDRFSSTASMLMRRGIPAVVAMQYEISDTAAIGFARGFYDAIAAQQPVDQAVTRARRAIKISRRSTLEWATPVLYLRSSTGALFDLTDVSAAPASQAATPNPTSSTTPTEAASLRLPPRDVALRQLPTPTEPWPSSDLRPPTRTNAATYPPLTRSA
jgi:CHAT domain-containing protein